MSYQFLFCFEEMAEIELEDKVEIVEMVVQTFNKRSFFAKFLSEVKSFYTSAKYYGDILKMNTSSLAQHFFRQTLRKLFSSEKAHETKKQCKNSWWYNSMVRTYNSGCITGCGKRIIFASFAPLSNIPSSAQFIGKKFSKLCKFIRKARKQAIKKQKTRRQRQKYRKIIKAKKSKNLNLFSIPKWY